MIGPKNITIKGTRDGLLITVGTAPLEEMLEQLAKQLRPTASFFRGGQAILHLGDREMSQEELSRVDEVIGKFDMAVRYVVSSGAATRRAARALGLRAMSSLELSGPRLVGSADAFEGSEGVLVRRTVRSGQVVRHPGHVAVIGDVNAGAEIVAGGDVLVWGKLRGVVHAGAMGDDSAVVCALWMAPIQLRIGQHIARPPEGGELKAMKPEMALVRNGSIQTESWPIGR
jgi:septum site-determining protein MinC